MAGQGNKYNAFPVIQRFSFQIHQHDYMVAGKAAPLKRGLTDLFKE
jgi:hypothetical protein